MALESLRLNPKVKLKRSWLCLTLTAPYQAQARRLCRWAESIWARLRLGWARGSPKRPFATPDSTVQHASIVDSPSPAKLKPSCLCCDGFWEFKRIRVGQLWAAGICFESNRFGYRTCARYGNLFSQGGKRLQPFLHRR